MNLFDKLKSKFNKTADKQPPNESIFETCVCCGKKISVQKDTPIEKREYYLSGAGQLCSDCYAKLISTDNNSPS